MPILSEEQRALHHLEQPETYPGLESWLAHELVFRVWRYPTFGAYSTWLLRDQHGEFRVRRLEWDRSKLSLGEPKIFGSESPVPTEQAASIVQGLRAITLSPFAEPASQGIDGVIFGVESKSHYVNGRLSWWQHPPQGWEALAEWFANTIETLDSLLPESTARMSEPH